MKIFIIFFLLSVSVTGYTQKSSYQGFPSLVWPKLYDINYVKEKDSLGEYDRPVFSREVSALQNKVIILPGYMVPLENETSASSFMLSSLPLNACFFCGVGGPETVVQVNLKSTTKYIEKPIQVRGVLTLNDENPDAMMYVLQQAEVLGALDY
jgi:hypothetical protein